MTQVGMAARKPDTAGEGKRTIEEIRAELWRQREKLHQSLTNLDRAIAALDEAAGVVPIPRGGRMIQRIVSYLEHTERPLGREDLIQALFDAGAGAGREDGKLQIGKSLDYHTIDKRLRKHRLKIVNGLIGLAEWTKEQFG